MSTAKALLPALPRESQVAWPETGHNGLRRVSASFELHVRGVQVDRSTVTLDAPVPPHSQVAVIIALASRVGLGANGSLANR
jgi:hypothetical protein